MKKVRFPRITLPAIVLGLNLFNNMILLSCMFVIFLFLGHHFELVIFWLLPLTMLLAAFSVGLGLIVGIVNVFVRDLTQVVPIILQMLFWFTPIVYPVSIIPEKFRHLLELNPVYHFVSAYHEIIVYGQSPQLGSTLIIGTLTILFLTFSLVIFRRANEEMVDVL